jgi:hypothetical protein
METASVRRGAVDFTGVSRVSRKTAPAANMAEPARKREHFMVVAVMGIGEPRDRCRLPPVIYTNAEQEATTR